MTKKLLTFPIIRLLYLCSKKDIKRKNKPHLPMVMSDEDWAAWLNTKKELGL